MTDGGDAVYQAEPIFTEIAGGRMVFRAGCIRVGQRNAWGRPYWHFNPSHRTAGFQLLSPGSPVVELNADDRIVTRGTFAGAGEEVLTIDANVDESMAKAGIFAAGASGGGTLCTISLHKYALVGGVLEVQEVSPRSLSHFPTDFANIWFSVTSWVPPEPVPG